MTFVRKVRQQLKDLGFRPNLGQEIESMGIELTVCQLTVVVLSIISVVFLFTPLFYLQDFRFILIFFTASIVCLMIGIWFWLHQAEICEHPEEFSE